jgi:hypothetical protein
MANNDKNTPKSQVVNEQLNVERERQQRAKEQRRISIEKDEENRLKLSEKDKERIKSENKRIVDNLKKKAKDNGVDFDTVQISDTSVSEWEKYIEKAFGENLSQTEKKLSDTVEKLIKERKDIPLEEEIQLQKQGELPADVGEFLDMVKTRIETQQIPLDFEKYFNSTPDNLTANDFVNDVNYFEQEQDRIKKRSKPQNPEEKYDRDRQFFVERATGTLMRFEEQGIETHYIKDILNLLMNLTDEELAYIQNNGGWSILYDMVQLPEVHKYKDTDEVDYSSITRDKADLFEVLRDYYGLNGEKTLKDNERIRELKDISTLFEREEQQIADLYEDEIDPNSWLESGNFNPTEEQQQQMTAIKEMFAPISDEDKEQFQYERYLEEEYNRTHGEQPERFTNTRYYSEDLRKDYMDMYKDLDEKIFSSAGRESEQYISEQKLATKQYYRRLSDIAEGVFPSFIKNYRGEK